MIKRQFDKSARADPTGKTVRDHHDGGMIFSCLGDVGERLAHSLGDLTRTLASWRAADFFSGPQSLRQLWISCLDLLAKQALPGSDMDLSQPLIGSDLQSSELDQRLCGLATSREVAGIQRRRLVGGKYLRRTCRLLVPQLVERNVGLTLKAVDHVPLGATVTPQDDPGGRHRRSSTPSSISGQSRHNRSSA